MKNNWISPVVLFAAFLSLAAWMYQDLDGQQKDTMKTVQEVVTAVAVQQSINMQILKQLERIEKKTEFYMETQDAEKIDREVEEKMQAVIDSLEREAK